MAASMVRLVHVIANACAKKLFRVPLVANIFIVQAHEWAKKSVWRERPKKALDDLRT